MAQLSLSTSLQWMARLVLIAGTVSIFLATIYRFFSSPFSLFSLLLCSTGLFFSWLIVQFISMLKVGRLGGGVFLGALLLRVVLIFLSPPSNQLSDISGHREMGQLVAGHINPYDPNDNPSQRQRLRQDEIGFTEFQSQSQAMWDYHVGSQLPLYTFMTGWIENVWPSPYAHRLFYTLFDSLLCLLLYAFILSFWPLLPAFKEERRFFWGKWKAEPWVQTALLSGAISPLLLRSGTLIPSSKGLMTLLVLGGIYFATQPGRLRPAYRGGVLLGASIAYMALGVFVFPLFLYVLYQSAKKTGHSMITPALIGICAVGGMVILWVAPFTFDLLHIVEGRANFGVTNAIHASMWRIWADLTPAWRGVRTALVGLFMVVCITGVLRRRFGWYVLTGLPFLAFLYLVMIDGSMDRIGIGLLLFTAMLGVEHPKLAHALFIYSFFGGILLTAWAVVLWLLKRFLHTPYVPFEVLDSAFNFTFFLAALGGLSWIAFQKKSARIRYEWPT